MNVSKYARRRLAVLLVGIGVIAGGLSLGANLPANGVGAPTPTATATLADTSCQEDEPCWDCQSMGNLICGAAELPEDLKRTAWLAFDAAGGAEYLLVDTHAKVSLVGYSLTDPYQQGEPELAVNQLALHDSGVWYIFTAETI